MRSKAKKQVGHFRQSYLGAMTLSRMSRANRGHLTRLLWGWMESMDGDVGERSVATNVAVCSEICATCIAFIVS